MTRSSSLPLESGNRFNEDDTKTAQVGDRGLSRKRQSLRKKPRREDGKERGGRPEEERRVAGDYSQGASSSIGHGQVFPSLGLGDLL